MILGRDIKLPDDSPEEEEVVEEAGRSNRDVYINAMKQLGKDVFISTWQLPEKDIILVINKNQ